MSEIYDLAIIGAGPGGISAAVEAKALGLKKVIIFEKTDNHSATIRQFYKDNKRVDKDWNGQKVEFDGNVVFFDGTKETTLDFFDMLIRDNKIESHFTEEIESIVHDETHQCFRIISTRNRTILAHHAIIAIGRMGKPNKPDYTIPPSLRKNVNFNLDYCSQGEKILVVGGGNSAIEYAIDLAERNDVALCYRQTNFTRLNATNLLAINRAFSHGTIRPLLGVNITELHDHDSHPHAIFDTMESETFDRIVYAIGGTTPLDFLKKCHISIDNDKQPILDDNYQTSVKNLYISGDLALKNGGSIGIALGMSYKIVYSITQQN